MGLNYVRLVLMFIEIYSRGEKYFNGTTNTNYVVSIPVCIIIIKISIISPYDELD